jgi:hypothetical protein
LSLFAHGPGGVEYLRTGGDVGLGVLLFSYSPIFVGFQIVIFHFKIRDVFFKGFIPHFLEFGFKFVGYSVIY